MTALTAHNTAATPAARLARVVRRLGLLRHAEYWLGATDRARSLREVRARVVAVADETADTKTFYLRPNALWRGHLAGQYTPVELELDGVRVRRCYTIASASSDPTLALTVKRVPGGRVSNALHDRVAPGHVLVLGPAAGDFVLPSPAPDRLLLYSGGSGITPVASILRELSARDSVPDVALVHHARSRADVIFADELRALGARHPGLRLHLRLDDALPADRRFDPAWLSRAVPDWAERTTMLCGPPGLMALVEDHWERANAGHRLQRERFAQPPTQAVPAGEVVAVRVRLSRSGRSLAGVSSRPLLQQLERAGERPAYGCRMGICNSCVCKKHSGAVRDLVTGEVSNEPDEDIRLCISAPASDVDLAM